MASSSSKEPLQLSWLVNDGHLEVEAKPRRRPTIVHADPFIDEIQVRVWVNEARQRYEDPWLKVIFSIPEPHLHDLKARFPTREQRLQDHRATTDQSTPVQGLNFIVWNMKSQMDDKVLADLNAHNRFEGAVTMILFSMLGPLKSPIEVESKVGMRNVEKFKVRGVSGGSFICSKKSMVTLSGVIHNRDNPNVQPNFLVRRAAEVESIMTHYWSLTPDSPEELRLREYIYSPEKFPQHDILVGPSGQGLPPRLLDFGNNSDVDDVASQDSVPIVDLGDD